VPLLNHRVSAKEPFAISFNRRLQPQRFPCGIPKICTHQHNAGDGALPAKYKQA